MNIFISTEFALYPMQPMLLGDYPFFLIFYVKKVVKMQLSACICEHTNTADEPASVSDTYFYFLTLGINDVLDCLTFHVSKY